MQCLLWRCVLVLSALRAVLQAVVQSAVLRSCASRPCALQHSHGSSAAPSNLLFPGASAAPLHAHLCAGMCAEPYTHVQRFPCTHTCAFTHTCNRILAQPCVRSVATKAAVLCTAHRQTVCKARAKSCREHSLATSVLTWRAMLWRLPSFPGQHQAFFP